MHSTSLPAPKLTSASATAPRRAAHYARVHYEPTGRAEPRREGGSLLFRAAKWVGLGPRDLPLVRPPVRRWNNAPGRTQVAFGRMRRRPRALRINMLRSRSVCSRVGRGLLMPRLAQGAPRAKSRPFVGHQARALVQARPQQAGRRREGGSLLSGLRSGRGLGAPRLPLLRLGRRRRDWARWAKLESSKYAPRCAPAYDRKTHQTDQLRVLCARWLEQHA